MDTFSAKGLIFSKLLHTPLLDNNNNTNNNTNNTNNLDNSTSTEASLNNSLNSSEKNNSQDLPILEGGWELGVKRGEVNLFQSIFTLSKNGKILNAFALHNLKNNNFVQINQVGTEIIRGTVDLTSAGLKNGTLSGIDATIAITGLTHLSIFLDKNITKEYFNSPLFGETKIFADASGNLLVGPRPDPSSPPSPQTNSFYDSNFNHYDENFHHY
jgi:hypothetical protein